MNERWTLELVQLHAVILVDLEKERETRENYRRQEFCTDTQFVGNRFCFVNSLSIN